MTITGGPPCRRAALMPPLGARCHSVEKASPNYWRWTDVPSRSGEVRRHTGAEGKADEKKSDSWTLESEAKLDWAFPSALRHHPRMGREKSVSPPVACWGGPRHTGRRGHSSWTAGVAPAHG